MTFKENLTRDELLAYRGLASFSVEQPDGTVSVLYNPTEKELKIGSELIRQLTAPFQPHKFENEHQKKLHHLIGKKVRGEKIALLRPSRRRPTEPDKLLQALEASLKKVA